jgi:hypothetical protein
MLSWRREPSRKTTEGEFCSSTAPKWWVRWATPVRLSTSIDLEQWSLYLLANWLKRARLGFRLFERKRIPPVRIVTEIRSTRLNSLSRQGRVCRATDNTLSTALSLCNWADANAPQWIQWGAMRATDEAACVCAWIRNEKVNCAVIN